MFLFIMLWAHHPIDVSILIIYIKRKTSLDINFVKCMSWLVLNEWYQNQSRYICEWVFKVHKCQPVKFKYFFYQIKRYIVVPKVIWYIDNDLRSHNTHKIITTSPNAKRVKSNSCAWHHYGNDEWYNDDIIYNQWYTVILIQYAWSTATLMFY